MMPAPVSASYSCSSAPAAEEQPIRCRHSTNFGFDMNDGRLLFAPSLNRSKSHLILWKCVTRAGSSLLLPEIPA